MKKYGVDAVPFSHEKMDEWRENFKGIQYVHRKTGLVISGAIDDIWVNPAGELIIVDYKATAKDGKIESLADSGWDRQYKRQMEVYQWLFRRAGFKVSDTGYFVYVNGQKDRKAFDGKLEFDVTLIAHKGDDTWVEGSILLAKECLDGDALPEHSSTCEYCMYRKFVQEVQTPFAKNLKKKKEIKIHETDESKTAKLL
jgi:RecB family exonuclease